MRLGAPLVLLLLACTARMISLPVRGAPAPGSQPNIVLILVDDQDATLNST
jgi:hypothetical protein